MCLATRRRVRVLSLYKQMMIGMVIVVAALFPKLPTAAQKEKRRRPLYIHRHRRSPVGRFGDTENLVEETKYIKLSRARHTANTTHPHPDAKTAPSAATPTQPKTH